MKKTIIILGSIMMMAAPAMAEDGAGKHQGQNKKGKMMQMFKAADVNGDKAVTKDEFIQFVTSKALERFAKMDRNGDGVIDRSDAPKRDSKEHTMPNMN